MSEIIKVYQEINKRRQADNMDVNSLTMFAESWDFQQAKIDELQARIDDLNELNRLKTIALQQSLNRTSIHVHEKIIALEKKLKGNKDEN